MAPYRTLVVLHTATNGRKNVKKIPDPYARTPWSKSFSPSPGPQKKRTFWCGRPRFSAQTSMTRRALKILCAKKSCVEFLVPNVSTFLDIFRHLVMVLLFWLVQPFACYNLSASFLAILDRCDLELKMRCNIMALKVPENA